MSNDDSGKADEEQGEIFLDREQCVGIILLFPKTILYMIS